MLLARLASSAVSGAIMGALTPMIALLLLAPSEYGLFSTIYLFFAYGVSLQYSIVSEAWARARQSTNVGVGWHDYSAALGYLSAVVAAVALGTSILVPELRPTALMLGFAVFFSVYRSGARYYSMAQGTLNRVVTSDVLGITAMGVALAVLNHEDGIWRLSVGWFASAAVSAVALGLPSLRRPSGPLVWLRSHGSEIKPLLLDSTLMDAGAIGTPFLLVGFMGVDKFGLYRGVANAAMPVRLLVDPLRPALGRQPRDFLFRRWPAIATWGVTMLIAGASYAALAWVVPLLPFSLGTLSELVPYAAPAALFAAGNFLGQVFYVINRTNASRKTIMTGRIFQTVAVVGLPVIGFLLDDLTGAIWGFAISATGSALVWAGLSAPLPWWQRQETAERSLGSAPAPISGRSGTN